MRMRYIAPLAMAATLAIGFAPIAAAAPTATTNTGDATLLSCRAMRRSPLSRAWLRQAGQLQYPFFGTEAACCSTTAGIADGCRVCTQGGRNYALSAHRLSTADRQSTAVAQRKASKGRELVGTWHRGNLLRLLALVVAAWTLRRAALTADSVDR